MVMTRFLESCREAIANDEMDAPGAYTPPTQAEISASEEALEIEFPDDFLRFHAECDGHHLPFWEVLTLSGSAGAGTHIVAVNRRFRRKAPDGVGLPEHLVAFHDDGTMNLHCFDTSERDEDGEYEIVCWDHESEEDDEPAVWGDSFAEWLEDQVEGFE